MLDFVPHKLALWEYIKLFKTLNQPIRKLMLHRCKEKIKMKTSLKVLSSAVLLVTTQFANAAIPGFYAGIGGGYSNSQIYDDAINFDDGGFAARLFAGHNFNQYFGVEANYTNFHRAKYGLYNYPITLNYKSDALSLAGKLYLPLAHNRANIYAMLGFAQVYTDANASVYNLYSSPIESSNGLVATVGFGGSYELTERLTANAELSGFGEKHANQFDNDFGFPGNGIATIGIAYKF